MLYKIHSVVAVMSSSPLQEYGENHNIMQLTFPGKGTPNFKSRPKNNSPKADTILLHQIDMLSKLQLQSIRSDELPLFRRSFAASVEF